MGVEKECLLRQLTCRNMENDNVHRHGTRLHGAQRTQCRITSDSTHRTFVSVDNAYIKMYHMAEPRVVPMVTTTRNFCATDRQRQRQRPGS